MDEKVSFESIKDSNKLGIRRANTRSKRSFSAELYNLFTIEEIKAEVQCWKQFKERFSVQTTWLMKTSYFKRMCGEETYRTIPCGVLTVSRIKYLILWHLHSPGLCLANPKDQKLLAKFRKVGLRRLNFFLTASTKKEIQSRDVKLTTWCCLSLLSFFYTKRPVDECYCFKASRLNSCKNLFRTALYLLLPEKQDDVIKYTITYISYTHQWNSDDYDLFVFQVGFEELLGTISKPELLIAKIIKQAEITQKEDSFKEAVNICSTLSSILESVHWDKYLFNHLLHNCLNTLLKLYLLCSAPVPSNLKIENVKLRMVIKACTKGFISHIRDNKECRTNLMSVPSITKRGNIVVFDSYKAKVLRKDGVEPAVNEIKFLLDKMAVFNYAPGLVSVLDSMAKCLQDKTIEEQDRREILELLAFCAQKHQTKYYRESITPDLLDLVLENIYSSDKFMAMTTHKVLHHLLDRHRNEKFFTEPVYFFKGRSNFTINYDFSVEDVHFFKGFFKNFLDGISYNFLTFTEKHCLINCYLTLCLILVEIPDPVITINIIHILITTQNLTLNSNDLPMTVKTQIHAIICAIVSLVCLVHQDEVAPLKKYVEEVVRFRTENSPHLLPPLQNSYNVASHHTVEYHDQLYFLEDEVLYALQRCWLGKRMTDSK